VCVDEMLKMISGEDDVRNGPSERASHGGSSKRRGFNQKEGGGMTKKDNDQPATNRKVWL
jgi:hypothetical protein